MNPADPADSFFAAIGGHDTFVTLVDRFYDGVSGDPTLRPMYPDDDLEPAKLRLAAFLEQYWGGPTTYSDARGHPRLRARHAAFRITPFARDRWLDHMRAAVENLGLPQEDSDTLWDYLERAARSLINTLQDGET